MSEPKRSKLTIEELLTLLMEECGEVIQAAAKCQRFGFSVVGPDDYGQNDHVLASEMGDVLGVIDCLTPYLTATGYLIDARKSKMKRAECAKYLYGKPLTKNHVGCPYPPGACICSMAKVRELRLGIEKKHSELLEAFVEPTK